MSETTRRPLIVGIQGSPRLGGNTDILLDAALKGAEEVGADTLKIVLNELNMRPCQGCGGCSSSGHCVLPDDMTMVYEAIEKMDGMVLTSPVYFGGVTAQTKMMIDRAQALWARKYLLKKPVSADGKKRDLLFLCTLTSDLPAMIEGIRNEVKFFLDTFDGEYNELIFPKVEERGEIAEHWEALGQAREAGARLATAR